MSFQISGQFDASGCGQSKGCLYYPTGCMPNQNCQIQFSFLVCQFGIIFESWRRLVSFEKDWSLKFKYEIWSTFSTCFCCCNDQLYFAIPKNLFSPILWMSWFEQDDDYLNMEISSPPQSDDGVNRYAAIGFSEDTSMVSFDYFETFHYAKLVSTKSPCLVKHSNFILLNQSRRRKTFRFTM